MATVEYICLACGNHFAATACTSANRNEKQCPHCKSANTYTLTPKGLSVSFAAGG